MDVVPKTNQICKMDLSNMSPKDKQRYEVAFENMTTMLEEYDTDEELPEMIMAIRRAEYKRGKADGIKQETSYD